MRICIINPFYNHETGPALEGTGRYRHVDALASALARRNHDVFVIQAFHEERTEHHSTFELRLTRMLQRSIARLEGGFLGIDLLARANLKRIIEAANNIQPDIVHMNGLTLIQPLSAIGAWCSANKRPLTVSYHGGLPRKERWLRQSQRRILANCSSVFFSTLDHAQPWISARLLRENQIVPCMEVSRNLCVGDRMSARLRTGMTGQPVFAWNARLHPIKDPITALRGFSLIRRRWPNARLYMIYLTDEMWTEVSDVVASDPALSNAVEFRGRIPFAAVQDFLNSADFLIQTSVREVGGTSVLEAMACGVVPILTDIPSFRAMTDGGQCGILFPIGRYDILAERMIQFDLANLESQSRKVREFFLQSFSYEAIARVYEQAFVAAVGDVNHRRTAVDKQAKGELADRITIDKV